jgi:hypothetical protein
VSGKENIIISNTIPLPPSFLYLLLIYPSSSSSSFITTDFYFFIFCLFIYISLSVYLFDVISYISYFILVVLEHHLLTPPP